MRALLESRGELFSLGKGEKWKEMGRDWRERDRLGEKKKEKGGGREGEGEGGERGRERERGREGERGRGRALTWHLAALQLGIRSHRCTVGPHT